MAWALWEFNVGEITEVDVAVPFISTLDTVTCVLGEVVSIDLSEFSFHVTCGEGTDGEGEEEDCDFLVHFV